MPVVHALVNKFVDFVHSAAPVEPDGKVYYPGERTLLIRKENREKGIPVDEDVWKLMTEK